MKRGDNMNKLRFYREKQCLSIEQLAVITAVSARYIRFIEDGKQTHSLKIAIKLSKALKVPIEDIFLPSNCTNSTVQ